MPAASAASTWSPAVMSEICRSSPLSSRTVSDPAKQSLGVLEPAGDKMIASLIGTVGVLVIGEIEGGVLVIGEMEGGVLVEGGALVIGGEIAGGIFGARAVGERVGVVLGVGVIRARVGGGVGVRVSLSGERVGRSAAMSCHFSPLEHFPRVIKMFSDTVPVHFILLYVFKFMTDPGESI